MCFVVLCWFRLFLNSQTFLFASFQRQMVPGDLGLKKSKTEKGRESGLVKWFHVGRLRWLLLFWLIKGWRIVETSPGRRGNMVETDGKRKPWANREPWQITKSLNKFKKWPLSSWEKFSSVFSFLVWNKHSSVRHYLLLPHLEPHPPHVEDPDSHPAIQRGQRHNGGKWSQAQTDLTWCSCSQYEILFVHVPKILFELNQI